MISILNVKTNFFSILILGYCVYVMVYYKSIQLRYIRLIALAFILEVGKFQGYFLAIGKSEVSYEDAFVTILLAINCVSMAKHKRYDKKTFIVAMALLTVALLGIIMENIAPYQGLIIPYNSKRAWDGYAIGVEDKTEVVYSVTRFMLLYVRILSLATTILVINKKLPTSCYKIIIRKISGFGKIVLSYGVVELVLKNIFHSNLTNRINCTMFGLGISTYTEIAFSSGLARLQGFTREPSHFSMAIFYFVLIIIMNDLINNTKKTGFWLPVSMLLLLMCRSFAALVYLILIFVFVFTFYRKGKSTVDVQEIKQRLWCISGFAIAVVIALLLCGMESYFSDRLAYVVRVVGTLINGGSVPVNSDVVRLISIIDTTKDFLHRPLLGLGMGVEAAHSGVVSMLADIGVLGVFFWWKLVASIPHDKRGKTVVLVWILAANLLCGTQRIMYSVVVMVFIVFCQCMDKRYEENISDRLALQQE